MKKTFLLMVLVIGLGFLNYTHAQLSAASATWGLVGATGQTVATAGQLVGTPESYTGLKFGAPAYKTVGTDTMQRLIAIGAGWPANQTSKIDTLFIQFAVTPKTGNIFHVNSISLGVASLGSISSMKADIYYSTDPTFATASLVSYSTGLPNYTGPGGVIVTNPLNGAALTQVNATIDVTINVNQKLYVRVYPWVDQDPTVRTGKYIGLKNLVISGQTESVPVPSSVVWPCKTDLSATTSGFMIAGTPTLSNLLNYGYSLAYNSVKGLSIYTGAVWPLETAPADGRFMQFSVYPKTGGTMIVDSLTLKMAAYSTNNLLVSIYYSTDVNFTLATGTALLSDVAVTNNLFSKSIGNLNITVNSGSTLYFRIYPYHNTIAGDDKWKLVGLNDVTIYGSVSGVIADPATIVNTKASYISTTFAKSGGNIPSDGGAAVTARGVCWSTNANPTVADSKTLNGSGSGAFTSKITGLTPGTLYHYRAFATNSTTTAYGGDSIFTTLAAQVVPTVTRTIASNIMVTQAKAGGNATAWGGDSIVAKGVCWNTTGNPTVADSKTVNGSDLGSFSSIIYPLVVNTKYYFRAYATNGIGTGYSLVDSFASQVIAPDITKTVAKDGTGDYTSVQAAFNAVPLSYTGKWTIFVKPGTYYEKDTLVAGKVNVILRSIHPDSTIITFDAFSDSPKPGGGTMGTSGCATMAIDAEDFTAINITIQNTKKNIGSGNLQAVALRSNGDRQSFFNCKIMGYQDTYYAWGGSAVGRVFMKNCYLEGSVDYIFGRDIVIFDSCQMHTNREGGAVCAPNTDATSSFGFVFMNSKLTSLKPGEIGFDTKPMVSFYLGRPWQSAPMCVYLNCEEPVTLNPLGWTFMQTNPSLFAEYKCYGPGSDISARSTTNTSSTVASRQLTDVESANYSIPNIFAKTSNVAFAYDWIPDMTIYKLSQNIGTLPVKSYGDNYIVVNSSSKLPIALSSSNTNVAVASNDTIYIKNAGSSNIKAVQWGNFLYSAAPDSMINYSVLPLEIAVAIDNTSKVYGDALPTLTATYTGLVNGDVASDIVALSTTGTASSIVGTYPITATSSSDNYTLTVTDGVLTVNKAALSAIIDNQSKVYGGTLPALTATYTGLVNGDVASALVSLSTTGTASSIVGTYPITVTGTPDNYTLTVTDGVLTVNKAPLTITADDKSRKAGTANPDFTLTYAGFVNGDDASKITAPVASCTADLTSIAGTYDIILTGGSATNYTLSLVKGTLTVTPGVGVKELSAADISVYPNPASQQITIKRNGASNATLLIMNSTGQIVIEKQIVSEQETIDITSLAKGLYILKLQGLTYKIVIQ